MLFQHFDWDLTHQILFLYIYFAQPPYELERPALDNAHTLENIHTLWIHTNMDFFLLETLKITFKIRNLTQNGHNQDIFFPKLGECFPIFEKGQGRPPPPSPSSYAPDISLCFIQINTKSPAKLLIPFRESTVFLKSSPVVWAAR